MCDEITTPGDELPSTAGDFAADHSKVWGQYAGPRKASSGGTVHAHVGRGSDEETSPGEPKHVPFLAIPTNGFPRAMAAMSRIHGLIEGRVVGPR